MACIASAAKGHEFWIDPLQHQVAPGDAVQAELRVGEAYEGSRQAYLPRNFRQFDYLLGDETFAVESILLGGFEYVAGKEKDAY